MANGPTFFEFLEIFPEFESVSSSKVDYWLSQAILQVGKDAFGVHYNHAVYLLTAHSLTMVDPSRAKKGALASEKAGDLSRSYHNGGGQGDSDLGQTQYGKQFQSLLRKTVISVNVVQ